MMNNDDTNLPFKESGYDQKAYTQFRLHNLLSKIDELSIQPEKFYQEIFNLLSSVFQTIYSKLKPIEKKAGHTKRKQINDFTKSNPIIKQGQLSWGKSRGLISPSNMNKFMELLFEFRCLLEEYMDAHGFNPSKEDVTQSIIKM